MIKVEKNSKATPWHIHKPPQFSRTAAFGVSPSKRAARARRLVERAETGSPARKASRSSARAEAEA